jgi:nucleotide-binding universal stress UspA family protein
VQRILAAVALPGGAVEVLRTGVRIANSFGAELAVAHVDVVESPAAIADPLGRRARLAASLRDAIDAARCGDRVSQAIVLAGSAAGAVTSYAEREGFDLVIVGGDKEREAERLRPGATARTIIRAAHCPVLCVDVRRPATRIRSVVYAADLREGSEPPAAAAALFAARLGASLTVVHVTGFLSGSVYGLTRAEAHARTAEREAMLETLRRQLADAVLAHGGNPRDVLARRVEGTDPAAGILRAAADARADLVVCGLCWRARFEPQRIGGLCEAILDRATASVLVGRTIPAR